MKKSTAGTQAQRLRQAIRHRQAQEKDAESYSDVLWAVVHGIASLAMSMPTFDASRLQRTMETAWQMACQGLRQH